MERGLSKEEIFWECYSKKAPSFVLDDLRESFDKEFDILAKKYGYCQNSG